MTTSESTPLITLTPEARTIVMDALANEENHDSLGLWVEVTGVRGAGYSYDLFFQDKDGLEEPVELVIDGEITIVVPVKSAARLRGSRLEFSDDNGGGLVLVNPNSPTSEEMNPGVPADILAKGLGGVLAQKALEVLEAAINPSIASHGGRADLVALDDDEKVAYVRLSGGGQGCAMSRMTLSQGIETTLKEEIPVLVGVVDGTDHDSGSNPFYER